MTHVISVPKSSLTTTQTLPVVELFHSIQGEGAWTGTNAFFIRLAGCDVGCPWCDTKQSWNPNRHPQHSVADLVEAVQHVQPTIVVITGGEPLMHDLTPLCTELKRAGLRLHLETSGAHPLSGIFDWVTFSPKRFKSPHPSIYTQVNELKVVIQTIADLEWAESYVAQVPASATCYLQPEWSHPESQSLIFDYILTHSHWRMSLQTHKLLGVR